MKNNLYLNVYTLPKNIICIPLYRYYLYEYYIFPRQQNKPKYSQDGKIKMIF